MKNTIQKFLKKKFLIAVSFLIPTLAYAQDTIPIKNPLGDNNFDPRLVIGYVIGAVLGIVGSIALVMFIAGGLTWMTAAGNPDKVKKGKDIIVWSVIGLAVIFLAYALVQFALSAFIGSTLGESGGSGAPTGTQGVPTN